MSRDDLLRARQLVRLRDTALSAAMRMLAASAADMIRADVVVAAALAARDAALARHAGARVALVDDPADAPAGLARIALAVDRQSCAEADVAMAEQARRVAEDALIAARLAARRARARLDAMRDRAHDLRRALARAAEERAASESDESAAAMRRAL